MPRHRTRKVPAAALLIPAALLALAAIARARPLSARLPLYFAGSQAVEALLPVRLTAGASCSRPLWSPDGEWVAFVRAADRPAETVIAVVSKGGSYGRAITNPLRAAGRPLDVARCFGWGGDRIFYAAEDRQEAYRGIWIWSVDRRGRDLRRVLKADDFFRAWPSPDGKRLLLLQMRQRGAEEGTPEARTRLRVYDLQTRDTTDLRLRRVPLGEAVGWLGDGHVLVGPLVVDVAAASQPAAGRAGVSPAGAVGQQTDLRVDAWSADLMRHAAIAPQESTGYRLSGDVCLYSAGQPVKTLFATRDALLPATSPDGRCVAFLRTTGLKDAEQAPAVEYLSLWAVACDEPHAGTLLAEQVDPPEPGTLALAPTWPAWSPRGDRILYVWGGDAWVAPVAVRPQTVEEKVAHGLPLTDDEKVEWEAQQASSNLKQIGLALMMYAQDYDERFPHDPERVVELLGPYVRNTSVFGTPSSPERVVFRYVVPPAAELSGIESPATTVVGTVDYHPAFQLYLFADGHVERRRPGT